MRRPQLTWNATFTHEDAGRKRAEEDASQGPNTEDEEAGGTY